ncbi:MAG: ABC-2 transporter permease [Tissierella sp.]|nr:ABC-2 transporter permease [Tissierella sp.]
MRGLVIKDILNLRKSIFTTLIIIFIYGIFSYSTGDMSMIIGMTALIITSMSVTSITYDYMAKWDSYALAMPITRKEIVLSKYILSMILCIIASIVSGSFSVFITYIRGDLVGIKNIQEIFLTVYIVFLIAMFFISINMPLIFKFGVENARILMLGSYIIPVGIGYLLFKMGLQLPSLEQLKILLYASPIILILILMLSASTTYEIYRRKDI